MRISDWSSDVCSSDLHRRGAHVGQHQHLVADPGADPDRKLAPEHDVEAAGGEVVEAALDHLLGQHRHLALLDRVDAADQRSEEHTSELQSLMRISYAVFCLKKKTNINKSNRRKQ